MKLQNPLGQRHQGNPIPTLLQIRLTQHMAVVIKTGKQGGDLIGVLANLVGRPFTHCTAKNIPAQQQLCDEHPLRIAIKMHGCGHWGRPKLFQN